MWYFCICEGSPWLAGCGKKKLVKEEDPSCVSGIISTPFALSAPIRIITAEQEALGKLRPPPHASVCSNRSPIHRMLAGSAHSH